MTRDEFIKEVLDGLETPPSYFPENVRMNKEGYQSIDKVLKQALRPLSPEEFEVVANEIGALMIDTRDARSFAKGFIPNSINIGLDGSFAPWVGALIPAVDHPLLIVADPGREDEVVTRLARVGFDNVYGFLNGGFESWSKAEREVDTIVSISPSTLERKMNRGNVHLIDVRKSGEYRAEHVENALNLPLGVLNQHLSEIPKDKTVFIHCAGGYRSMIACSILRARGWENIVDIDGGLKAIAETHIPRTDYVCATTKSKNQNIK